MDIPSKYADRIEVRADGCWHWTGWHSNALDGVGAKAPYAVIQINKKTTTAHRHFYSLANNVVLDSKTHVHHKCRNTLCVNPDHLEQLSQANHNRLHDAFGPINAKLKESCAHGHLWTPESTRLDKRDGSKSCKICAAIRLKVYRTSHKRKWTPKKRCKKGHPFSGDNLYVNPQGKRFCRQCNRERHHFNLPIT